jgi:competence protein ComEC
VLGLILFTRPVMRAIGALRDEDVAIAKSIMPKTRWSRFTARLDKTLVEVFAASVVAWLVSMPLIAFHFEQLNPWAIPFSLALGILVLPAIIFGFLKILLTLVWPGAAPFWVTITAWPIALTRDLVGWLATWPRSDVPVPPPPIWLIAIYYGTLLTMLVPWERRAATGFWRVIRVGMLLVLLWLPYETHAARRSPATNSLRVTLLAVGAGQCAVVEPPSGRVVLMDAGSQSLSDLVTKCLGPCLRNRGCTDVDKIVLSHADFDHISAAGEVAKAYDVHEVLTGAFFAEHTDANGPAARLLRDLDALQRPPRILEPGQRIPLGRDTSIEVLWPPRGASHAGSNDDCLVIKLTHAGRSILFPGDIQDAAMRELLKDPAKLKSDVLVAAHHGSSESLTAAFVEAVNPSAVVCSNDRSLSRK